MGITNGRWGRRRRSDRAQARAGASERALDLALIVEAARLAVTTRTASSTVFVRHLSVTDDVADELLRKLEHCEVIAPDEPGRTRRVLTTSAQLPGVVAEFERRHRERRPEPPR